MPINYSSEPPRLQDHLELRSAVDASDLVVYAKPLDRIGRGLKEAIPRVERNLFVLTTDAALAASPLPCDHDCTDCRPACLDRSDPSAKGHLDSAVSRYRHVERDVLALLSSMVQS